MHNVLLKFTFEDPEEIDFDPPTSLLSCFHNNCLLVDYFRLPVIKVNTLIYCGVLMQANALDSQYFTETSNLWIQRFREHYHIIFTYEVIAEFSSHIVTSLNEVPAFILYEGGYSPLRTL